MRCVSPPAIGPHIPRTYRPKMRGAHSLTSSVDVSWRKVCYHRDMYKTSVSLPQDLKRGLQRMAAETGQSEAQLIRESLTAHISRFVPPRPQGGLFTSGDSTLAESSDEALAGFGER